MNAPAWMGLLGRGEIDFSDKIETGLKVRITSDGRKLSSWKGT